MAPEASLFKEMPTGPKAFLVTAGRVYVAGLQPDPPKMALCHTCTLGGAYNKYQFTNQRDAITCDTIYVVDR